MWQTELHTEESVQKNDLLYISSIFLNEVLNNLNFAETTIPN